MTPNAPPLRKSRRWFLTAILPVVIGADRLRAEGIAMSDLKRAIEGGVSTLKFRLGSAEWEFIRRSRRWLLTGIPLVVIGARRVRADVNAMPNLKRDIDGGARTLDFRLGSAE